MNAIINKENLRMINVKHSARILGACIGTNLRWKDEFECVMQKMKRSIKNLMILDMKLRQVNFFIAYLLKIHFWIWNY